MCERTHNYTDRYDSDKTADTQMDRHRNKQIHKQISARYRLQLIQQTDGGWKTVGAGRREFKSRSALG